MQYLKADLTGNYTTFNFCKNNQILVDGPVCGMTLRSAGSMRFRWNEENSVRNKMLSEISCKYDYKTLVPVQLNHTHIVYDIHNPFDTKLKIGDGIITDNSQLIPTITVADCVPLYLYNSQNGVFGIVHSGWKGTGIICDAIELAIQNYGGQISDFSVVIGPHIHSCCYIVNQERADYFVSNFTEDCIVPLEEGGECKCGGRGLPVAWNNGSGKLYRLSLEKANLSALEKLGVPSQNIACIDYCTCCNLELGSNRRETALSGQTDSFTVQAAFITKK